MADSIEAPRSFPSVRVLAAIFGGVAVLLGAWYFLALRQGYAPLYSDLRPADAAAIVAELEDQNIRYKLAEGGSQILVPAAQLDSARLHMASPELHLGGVDGFELFNSTDMGLTEFAQKIRYQRALQGELARTIMMMEGVEDARVHISMPERALFRSERRNSEAAVTLVMRSPDLETQARIEGVQRLVAASVPDLSVSDVVVLNAMGELISPRVEITAARAQRGASADPATPSIEFVMEVMRRALPSRRFEVTIDPAPAPLEGSADEIAELADVNIVTVVTETALRADEMEGVRDLLRDAGVVDGDSGGTLSFRVGPPAMFEGLPRVRTSAVADTTTVEREPTRLPIGQIVSIIAALFAFGALSFVVRRRMQPALSFEDHKRLAERLKAGLRPEGEPSV